MTDSHEELLEELRPGVHEDGVAIAVELGHEGLVGLALALLLDERLELGVDL